MATALVNQGFFWAWPRPRWPPPGRAAPEAGQQNRYPVTPFDHSHLQPSQPLACWPPKSTRNRAKSSTYGHLRPPRCSYPVGRSAGRPTQKPCIQAALSRFEAVPVANSMGPTGTHAHAHVWEQKSQGPCAISCNKLTRRLSGLRGILGFGFTVGKGLGLLKVFPKRASYYRYDC